MDGFRDAVAPQVQQSIRTAYRSLIASGSARREGQQKMIAAIAVAASHARKRGVEPCGGDHLLAIDAPTGVGKTLAYALGAIPVAMASDLKVIIASATVQLQEQIVNKDLVTMKKVLPDMRVALVKGRGRYFCPSRAKEICSAPASGASAGSVELAHQLKRRFDAGSWGGDVDDLHTPPDPAAWAALTNDRTGCPGRSCSEYKSCPYYRVRSEANQAHVVVVNHDLLLTNLMNEAGILPRVEESIVVIDEAHELAAKATGLLQCHVDLQRCHGVIEHTMDMLGRIAGSKVQVGVSSLCRRAVDELIMLGAFTSECEQAIRASGMLTEVRDASTPYRLRKGVLPEWLDTPVQECARYASEARATLEAISHQVLEACAEEGGSKTLERMLSAVGNAVSKVSAMDDLWSLMKGGGAEDGPPTAKWIELNDDRSLRVCASPVSVSAALHDLLWSRCAAAIHLSATLKSVHGFSKHLKDTGLDRTQGVRTLEVASPFDYKNARLVVPGGIANPRDKQAHTRDVIGIIQEALTRQADGEGALILFASWSQLKEVASSLRPAFGERLLVQGEELSKREIIERHKSKVDAGKPSVILGTATFESGIDLPSRYLTLLVVSKIQFAVPSNPIVQAKREYMEEVQGLDFFDEEVVPDAYRRLAQSTGRLLRTEADKGLIIVTDIRLTTTRYGQKMLRTLPAFDVVKDVGPSAAMQQGVGASRSRGELADPAEDERIAWVGLQARPF